MDGKEVLKLPLWTLLLLTSSLLTPVNSQFQRAPEDSGCAPDTTCVLITECPRLLEILKQVTWCISLFCLTTNSLILAQWFLSWLDGTSSIVTVHCSEFVHCRHPQQLELAATKENIFQTSSLGEKRDGGSCSQKGNILKPLWFPGFQMTFTKIIIPQPLIWKIIQLTFALDITPIRILFVFRTPCHWFAAKYLAQSNVLSQKHRDQQQENKLRMG